MTGQSGEAMQVVYMEIEGIKLAYQVSKDALNLLRQLAKFLLCSLKDAPYKKVRGRTNMKNFLMRANGQTVIPCTMDQKSFKEFEKLAKKYGILYHEFHPLRSGKKGAVEIIIMEKDLAMFREILEQIKERQMREDVQNGMSEEQSTQDFDENNHTESMEEFAENVGAATSEEVFEEDMKERFGEDYEEKIVDFMKYKEEKEGKDSPKGKAAGVDNEKVDKLADAIRFKERSEKLKNSDSVQVQFEYDPRSGKSQIEEETETHVKITGKGFGENGDPKEWGSAWIPKDAIDPPLDRDAGADGKRTAYLSGNADVVVENPKGKAAPKKIRAKEWKAGTFVAEGVQYRTTPSAEKKKKLDITIGRTYVWEQSESKKAPAMIWEETEKAVKTRVPGTYGENMRFLWIEKEELEDAYDGKSFLSSLDADKEYKLYAKDGREAETIKGSELYRRNYDAVNPGVREKAGKQAQSAVRQAAPMPKGRGRSI